MEKIKIYPDIEGVRWVDKIDDGWFKDKDEFVHNFYHFQTSQNANVATNFDNFLMRYTHWVIEETKNEQKKELTDKFIKWLIMYCPSVAKDITGAIESLNKELDCTQNT